MTIYTAELIGQHALTFITTVTILIIIEIFVIWQLFDKSYRWWWQIGYSAWERISASTVANVLWKTRPDFWRFLGHRLSPTGYLGLHLTLGFTVSLVSCVIFGSLAKQVVEAQELVRFDQELATALYQNAKAFEVTFFRTVTNFGGREAIITIGLPMIIWLLLRKQKLLLLSWVVAIIGSSTLNAALKLTFQRARPTFEEPLLIATFYSFPSGHAMGSVVLYGMLVYIFNISLVDRRWIRVALICLAVWFILFIGFSRIYLGVHYFSDILAGYAAGVGWLAIVITGTELVRRKMKLVQQNSREEAQR